jgi:signal transduction histidine kinase
MMEPLQVALRVYQSDDPSAAFQALVAGLAAALPLRCAVYVQAEGRRVRDLWPAEAELTDDLLDTALHVIHPEIFTLGSEFPFDSNRFPGCELLVLPLHRQQDDPGSCLLVADAGAFGEDLQPWQLLAGATEDFERRHHRVVQAEERCGDLQRRVEESEALHTLGLAVNRTLDEGEVLNLVARFTRTMLGAHYATVSTSREGRILTVASVGLRNTEAAAGDYHLARAVVEAEKPLLVGAAGSTLKVEDFPFHAAEAMRVGLGIPLSLFGDTFGALVVGYRTEYEVTPHDTRLALTLAGHAAVAISNARLHERVEQRSRELEEAYEELNRVSSAKERFFASVNHELRNPIGAILGYHTLLLEGTFGELPEKAHAYLERANRGALTLRTLVDDLLDLSKIAAGKMELDLQPCSLSDVVEQAVSILQPAAAEKGIPLVVDGVGRLPPVRTDANRVQQILVNLLSNAIKFTTEGEVRLSVEGPAAAPDADGEGEPPRAVHLRVSDTGPGIPAEDLERVFEEFEQVKGTRGGTGLGLPISRRLAQMLGGDLWAESEVGRGSTFVLRLPSGSHLASSSGTPPAPPVGDLVTTEGSGGSGPHQRTPRPPSPGS